jgi:triosephosphate isomerase
MLAEFGCCHVIVGHSERRALHGESDQLVADKARRRSSTACADRLRRRDAGRARGGQTEAVVKRQLSAAIHTLGQRISQSSSPTSRLGDRHRQDRIAGAGAAVHALAAHAARMRRRASGRMRILYGGSVKADNAAQLFAEPTSTAA